MCLETIGDVTYFLTSNITIILTTATTLLIYIFLRSNKLNYWEKQGVNGPKPLPIVGNTWEKFRNPAYVITRERYVKYGLIFGFYDRSTPVLSVADPEILRYIFVKDSDKFANRRQDPSPSVYLNKMLPSLKDEKWKRVRSLMSQTFAGGKIKKMTGDIIRCIESMLGAVEEKVEANEEIDLKKLFGAYTIDVIASCAFAIKTNAHKDPNDPFVRHAAMFTRPKMWRAFVILLVPRFILKLINFNLHNNSIMTFFEAVFKTIIKERVSNNVKAHDFLQSLLDARDSEDSALTSSHKKTKLSDEEVIAQSLLFFLAAYDTTSTLLSYSSYALALNPEKQGMLYKEVKDQFEMDREITYDAVCKMKYLNAVVSETLRMYPPVVKLERLVSKNYLLPNTNVTVPKGAFVQMPVMDIHHDANNFPDPESFKPERFMPDNIDRIKPYTYLPFGEGPRNCIGMRFALMEAKFALYNIILNYKIVTSENTDIPLKMVHLPNSMLTFDKILLKMEKR